MNNIKEIFNTKVKDQYKSNYEYGRWFANPILHAGYEMTKRTIEKRIINNTKSSFDNYIEMGPGAGTWTKFFIDKNKEANFDLVDISGEMLSLAKKSLGEGNIKYAEMDFLDFATDKKYDIFFSSRVLEYIEDKKSISKKISELLNDGGKGFIITKTPHYTRSKILGRKLRSHHQGQIKPNKLRKILKESGFKILEIYPVSMQFPLLNSPKVNLFLYAIFSKFPLNFISEFFSESYYISFIKK